MSRVAQYEIVTAGDSRKLVAKVNEKIAEGWQPYGGPFTLADQFLQAVVLTAKAGKRIRKNSEDMAAS